jgi:hypothetical protein
MTANHALRFTLAIIQHQIKTYELPAYIFTVSLLIILHELGHFLAAKRMGIP